MHEKHRKDGLVCLSVSVDPLEEKERTLKFLRKVKATFANYLLDEAPNKVWQDHFGIFGPPAVFVYDRDGKLAKRFDAEEEWTYKEVEQVVEKLLRAGK